MSRQRLAALLLGVLGVLVVSIARSQADPVPGSDPVRQAAFEKIQRLLDEPLVDTRNLQIARPLTVVLKALEKQLPPDRKLALRIDGDAFGDKGTDVAATPLALPLSSGKISVRRVLEAAIKKSKTKIDYRLDVGGVTLTTPQRAGYVAVYDIRDIIARSALVSPIGSSEIVFTDKEHSRTSDPARRAALVVQALETALNPEGATSTPANQESIQVLNGNRLVIHVSAARHAQVSELLQGFRNASDVSVQVQTQLYEVDEAFYTRLNKARPLTLEDLEELIRQQDSDPTSGMEEGLGKILARQKKLLDRLVRLFSKYNELFTLLARQQMIQAGEEAPLGIGEEALLLSRHQVHRCLPGPEQTRRGEKTRQTVAEGVSILASVEVTSDRRFARVKLTERAVDLDGIDRVKVWDARAEKEVVAEIPLLKESSHSQLRDIPDGATLLVPVQSRPRFLQAKARWWVLKVTPRIIIAEEEKFYRDSDIESLLPRLVADILTNPRLKTTREFYGSPDDKRFALVDGAGWTWPKNYQPGASGFELVPAEPKGKRLLGIRIDQYLDDGKEGSRPMFVVSLLNAGGSANGAVVGGGTLCYLVKQGAKGAGVELAEPANP